MGIGSHHRSRGATDEWLTPPALLNSLGPFDLDPCCARPMPWATARVMWSEAGLLRPWAGRVWLNPPYNRDVIARWVGRLAEHGNGIALVFARTDSAWFQRSIFGAALAVYFLEGRVRFFRPDGTQPAGTSGGPSVLAAYGWPNVKALERCSHPGRLVMLR